MLDEAALNQVLVPDLAADQQLRGDGVGGSRDDGDVVDEGTDGGGLQRRRVDHVDRHEELPLDDLLVEQQRDGQRGIAEPRAGQRIELAIGRIEREAQPIGIGFVVDDVDTRLADDAAERRDMAVVQARHVLDRIGVGEGADREPKAIGKRITERCLGIDLVVAADLAKTADRDVLDLALAL